MTNQLPHVVIVGGGFAGLVAARVTLIDRPNHHFFQPLLYQVASDTKVACTISFRYLRQQEQWRCERMRFSGFLTK